jgi:hypothetical protein
VTDPPSHDQSPIADDCCDFPVDPNADFSTTTTPDFVNPGIGFADSRPATGCPLEFDFDCDGFEVPQGELPALFEGCDPVDCIPTPGPRRNLDGIEPACGDLFGLVVCGFDETMTCVELGDLADFVRCQ